MPALSSSPVDPAVGHLADLAAGAAEDRPGLLAVLARVTDPRHRRGVRYRLAVILGLAVCAVLAGARSFTAIAEWAADADQDTLRGLGVAGAVPSESTFRRTLQRLDADVLDELAGQWAARRTAPGPGRRRVIAVYGKTLRGSGHGGEDRRHLLAPPGPQPQDSLPCLRNAERPRPPWASGHIRTGPASRRNKEPRTGMRPQTRRRTVKL
jgi:DDE_Tnp_1-associated